MATIKTAVSLYDGVTGPLRSMVTILDTVIGGFEDLGAAADSGIDVSKIMDARAEFTKMSGQLELIENNIGQVGKKQQSWNTAIQESTNETDALLSKVKGLVSAYAGISAVKKVIDLSDQMSNTKARLDILVEDGGSVANLEKQIMASAQRSRSAYFDVADAVAKLGSNAKEAFGGDMNQVIAFSELVNKQFVLGGASAQEQSAAMLQLTQAMASGVLRGDELNSIFEQAPGLIRNIAEYLDVSVGEIRELAADGAITEDIVKNAMFSAAKEINEQFESMPMTWEQIWAQIQNAALETMSPVLDKISEMLNTDEFQAFIAILTDGFSLLSSMAMGALDLIASGAAFVGNNMSIILPILIGIGTASAVVGVQMVASALASAAAWATAHAPLIAIVAIIASVIFIVRAMGVTFEQIGAVVGGVFGALFAHIKNTFIAPLWNGFAMVANFVGNVFNDPVAAVQVAFYDMCLTVIGYIKNLAQAIETLLNKIPGVTVDITSGLDRFYADLEEAQRAVKDESGWVEYVSRMDFENYEDTWRAGSEFGSSVGEWLDNFSMEDFTSDLSLTDSAGGFDYNSIIAGNTADTAANTAKAANSLDIAAEDLAYMKDIAEREAINRYTTAEIVINQENNQINSEMDLDGIASKLADRIVEEVNISAEGVHIS